MDVLRKSIWVFQRSIIKKLCYINNSLYMKYYTKYLKKIGIKFIGSNKTIKFIEPSAYFDGTDYSLIELGDNIVISKEVFLLTHDYSITAALCSNGINIGRGEGELLLKDKIVIGNNSFVGARTLILPGTIIGENCIIGAGSVVKGNIRSGTVVAGNPCREIAFTKDYADRTINKKNIFVE